MEVEPAGILRTLLPASVPVGADRVDEATDARGAYMLVIRLGVAFDFRRGQAKHRLGPGWYVYAGSAYGSGGIRARLRRHFRRDKKIHWHVDQLTAAADLVEAAALPGGSECGIVAVLTGSGRFRHKIEGFGSSDCAVCPSHLLEPDPRAG